MEAAINDCCFALEQGTESGAANLVCHLLQFVLNSVEQLFQITEQPHSDDRAGMTNNDDIPPTVTQFILTKIDSVPHLEALLLIWEQGSKTWTEGELAKSLFVSLGVAKKIANDLMRRGWIKRAPATQDGYVYDQSWDSTGEFINLLAVTYRTKLVRVATLIHTNASAAVRDCSSAFDFKKE